MTIQSKDKSIKDKSFKDKSLKNISIISPGTVSKKSKKADIDDDGSQYCNLESVEVSLKE